MKFSAPAESDCSTRVSPYLSTIRPGRKSASEFKSLIMDVLLKSIVERRLLRASARRVLIKLSPIFSPACRVRILSVI